LDRKNKNDQVMDKTDAIKIAEKFAIALQLNYNFIRVILFGSYAKGNFNEDSDIDIAVVFKDYNNLIDMQLELMRLRRKIDSRIEPHPFRESDFDLSNPIVNEIVKYGKEIKTKVV
jgi:predicted nucleotidyltransferase